MLAAPIINGTLPAFYIENGTASIAVPFSMNRSINQAEIAGFSLKIKNIQGSSYLKTLSSTNIDFINSIVYFSIPDTELSNFYLGSFYKAQLAYVDKLGNVGYYSTVGIIKYTTRPEVKILDLEEFTNNGHIYNYSGIYSQKSKDITEKVYSYCFIVTDDKNNIIEDTGWIVHNNSTDTTPYESFDSYFFARDLIEGEKFNILYKVKTNNGLEVSSPTYRIISKKSIQSNLANATINLDLNFDNAYIKISLSGQKDEFGYELPVKGYYILSRASEESNYTQWEELDRFTLAAQRPSKKTWKDFTIEQGKKYKYSIQQYNDKSLFSERVLSKEIYADFEHSYLYDGERQLKIIFNPKVTSFKISRQEAKMETIGSKYPFIFRNGNIEYKEFPIGGLISYQSDEEGLFLNKNIELFKNGLREERYSYKLLNVNHKEYIDSFNNLYFKRREKYYPISYIYQTDEVYKDLFEQEIDIMSNKVFQEFLLRDEKFYLRLFKNMTEQEFNEYKIKGSDPTSQNIFLEREFKLEVLNWLTNGEPKLFKSPTEGNYLVRLMNVSLTPNDQLGRMLHTFNSTAYEIADNNYEAQKKYGIININEATNSIYLKIASVPLMTNDENYTKISHVNYYKPYENLNMYYAAGELVPFGMTLENFTISDVPPGTEISVDARTIIIGSTGKYSSPIPVTSVKIPFVEAEVRDRDDFYRKDSILFIFNTVSEKFEQATGYIDGVKYYALQKLDGHITMSYYDKISNSFNSILNTNIKDIYGKQFIGYHENIINNIEDIGNNIVSFYNINAYNRPLEEYYYTEEMLPIDMSIPEYQERYYDFYLKLVKPEENPDEEIAPEEGIADMSIASEGIADMSIASDFPAVTVEEDIAMPIADMNEIDEEYNGLAYPAPTLGADENDEEEDEEPDLFDEYGELEYVPAPYYDPALQYFVKTQTYYVAATNEPIFTIFKFLLTGDGYLFEKAINPLYGYGIQKDTIFGLGMPLYKKVKFMDVGNSDIKGSNSPNRNLENRTSSNPLIMDIRRDYPLLVESKQLFYFDTNDEGQERVIKQVPAEMLYTEADNIVYVLAFDFYEIFDPNDIWQKYMLSDDYEAACDFLKEFNFDFLTSFKNTYLEWETKIEINSRPFDLTETKYHSTGPNNEIHSYLIGSGCYCEAYYQEQNIEYDTSKISSLEEQKQTLQRYNKVLTRSYMKEKCATSQGEEDYIVELQDIRKNYAQKYNRYIKELEQYLESL